MGMVSYRLELPPGSLIHDVFHVSLLRKSEVHVPEPSPPPANEHVQLPAVPQPELILEERVVYKGKYRLKTEILVKWVGQSREDATWENKWHFARTYPHFHLEDKVVSSGVDCYGQPIQANEVHAAVFE